MVGVENKSESPANVPAESVSTTVTNNGNEVLKSDRNIVNTANHSSNGINKSLDSRLNNSGSQGLSKDVLASLASVENGFTQVFNLQRGKISTTPMYAESAAYFNEFKMQIQQIEADERQLKKEISKKGLTANQLDQLIDLYQYKLTVLKQLQLEMNKTNNRFKQNRGPVDSTRAYFINI